MPPNSISLEFQKMPTVTVDGKTHKFQADKAKSGFQSIQEGGVTYSLVKDAKGHFQMTITGEPAALEKYNFGVGKGRVTDAKFGGGDSMGNFFKGLSHVGDESEAPKYFQNFTIGGAQLANRTAFLSSGAWGIDQNSAQKELERLEEEAKKAATKAQDSALVNKQPPVSQENQQPAPSAKPPEKTTQENQAVNNPVPRPASLEKKPPVSVEIGVDEEYEEIDGEDFQFSDFKDEFIKVCKEKLDFRTDLKFEGAKQMFDGSDDALKSQIQDAFHRLVNPRSQAKPTLSGTLSNDLIASFQDTDGSEIQKRANQNWTALTGNSQAFQDNNLPDLKNYQHVAVEGTGFCSVTAMATYHGMKTSELIDHLRTVAQNTNQTAVLNEILQTMNTQSSGFELTKESYQKLFAEAGLSFWVVSPSSDNNGFNASAVGKLPPDANAPALLFTKQINSQEGHFDLLAPRGHLAGKINLPTDAQQYVKNDFKGSF